MSDSYEKYAHQQVIHTVSPIYYEIDTINLRDNRAEKQLLVYKYLYIISNFANDDKIEGRLISGKTGNDGRLYNNYGHRIDILPGSYYFFTSEEELEDAGNKIKRNICVGPITINSNNDNVEIKHLFYCKHTIGNYYDNRVMYVGRYGFGRSFNRAIFLIGGLHSNEDGGKNSIKVIESYIKNNPTIVPFDTSIFILNPASVSGKREINDIDPNRNFLDKETSLREVIAIKDFTRSLVNSYSNLAIISAHQYKDRARGTRGVGWVFSLYVLNHRGEEKIMGKKGDEEVAMKEGEHYENPIPSKALANQFVQATGFSFETMWKTDTTTGLGEMYPGEYINFLSKLHKAKTKCILSMIEFEIPESNRDLNSNLIDGLEQFIQIILGVKK